MFDNEIDKIMLKTEMDGLEIKEGRCEDDFGSKRMKFSEELDLEFDEQPKDCAENDGETKKDNKNMEDPKKGAEGFIELKDEPKTSMKKDDVEINEETRKRIKEELEETFGEHKHKLREEQKVIDEKQENIKVKEAEVVREKEELRRLQFKLNEKNAVMEIIFKMNDRTEKIDVNLSGMSSLSRSRSSSASAEVDTKSVQEMINLLREQERNLEVQFINQ